MAPPRQTDQQGSTGSSSLLAQTLAETYVSTARNREEEPVLPRLSASFIRLKNAPAFARPKALVHTPSLTGRFVVAFILWLGAVSSVCFAVTGEQFGYLNSGWTIEPYLRDPMMIILPDYVIDVRGDAKEIY
jgi:hypothetical protein